MMVLCIVRCFIFCLFLLNNEICQCDKCKCYFSDMKNFYLFEESKLKFRNKNIYLVEKCRRFQNQREGSF